jgi:hypothetical protein
MGLDDVNTIGVALKPFGQGGPMLVPLIVSRIRDTRGLRFDHVWDPDIGIRHEQPVKRITPNHR